MVRGQRKRLEDAATGEGEHITERPHSGRQAVGGTQEAGALVGGQVFAATGRVMNLPSLASPPRRHFRFLGMQQNRQ
jgi:hypothetical protein